MNPFDFDKMNELYRTDPDEFFRVANRLKEEWLSELPEERRQRMEAIQWRMDQELNRIKDPTERFNRVVGMFWEQVNAFQNVLNGKQTPKQKENVIPIRPE